MNREVALDDLIEGNRTPTGSDRSPTPISTDRNNNKETELCRDFQRGDCRRGMRCPFQHKDPTPEQRKIQEARATEMCRDFSRGTCPRGPRCYYSHEVPRAPKEQKNEICRDFNRGSCPRGASCQYNHIFKTQRNSTPPPREQQPDAYPYARKRPRYEYAPSPHAPTHQMTTIPLSEYEHLVHLKRDYQLLQDEVQFLRSENREMRRELDHLQPPRPIGRPMHPQHQRRPY